MTCRRAYELDLLAFLSDPRNAAWDDFRSHYPRCADCAPEVAAWTALHATLDRHPEPAELLRWNDGPSALATAEQVRVARHVERCASCRDELRALGRFTAAETASSGAAAALTQEAARVATHEHPASGGVVPRGAPEDGRPRATTHHPSAARSGGRHVEDRRGGRSASVRTGGRTGGRRDGSFLRRVVWHPAFAYAALAAVVLLPTFRDRFEHAVGGVTGAGVVSHTADAPAGSVRHEERSLAADGENTAGLDDALVDRTAPRLIRQAPKRDASPPAPPEARPDPRMAAPRPEAADAPPVVASAPRALGAPESSASIRLVPAGDGAGRVLAIALPEHLAGARVLEVRIRDDAGGRELRQRVERVAGAPAEVTVAFPVGFSAPRLVVEVYADGVGPLAGGVVSP